ncbi:MAG: alpha/beta fold hydrolase [Candidatus Tumulicola sp.]
MIVTRSVTQSDGAVAGARLAGESGPALIFVHGVGSTGAIWDYQLDAFGDYRCASMELRGNGALENPPPELITREGFASDVLAVADANGFKTFHLIGCSLGGVVAFELWQREPERLRSMVIVGSFARYPDGQTYADNIKSAVRAAGDMRTFAEARAAQLGLPPHRMRETIDQMGSKSVSSYLASTQATWTGDYRAVLPSIRVPVLVTRGERDGIEPQPLSDEIADGIPGAERDVVSNAGHVANADNPARFNEILREFIEATE